MKKVNIDNNGKRVKHLVIFNFKNDKMFYEKDKFLQDSKSILTSIEGVENFEILNQLNSDINYSFGFSMEFKDQETYESYKNNPIHLDYVKQIWQKDIEQFIGMDFNDYF
jgi:hypothetical protein